jgi:hypothetical protein
MPTNGSPSRRLGLVTADYGFQLREPSSTTNRALRGKRLARKVDRQEHEPDLRIRSPAEQSALICTFRRKFASTRAFD